MKFGPTDYNWLDWHKGLTPERQKRFDEIIEATLRGLEEILQRFHQPGMNTEAGIPIGIFSTGVVGDGPMYAPIVLLSIDPFPDYELLAKLSTTITNEFPVSRVVIRIQ